MKRFELLSIIVSIATVGIALGAVVIGSNANLRTDLRTEMESLRVETRIEVRELRKDVRADLRAVEGRLSALEQRQARTEGMLEGLRDAIVAQGLDRDARVEKEPT